jgi:hypothetical protein
VFVVRAEVLLGCGFAALGITSVIVLILSIIEFKADWASKAKQYGEAAERLGALKATLR